MTIYQYQLLMALKFITNPEYQEHVQQKEKDQKWADKVAKAAEKSRIALEEATAKLHNMASNEGINDGSKNPG